MKTVNHHILNIWMQTNCMDRQCLKITYRWFKIEKKCSKTSKNYYENSNKGHIFEADVEYPKTLQNLHSYLPFLPVRMKIRKSIKLVYNLYDKNNHVVHIRALKQALSYG